MGRTSGSGKKNDRSALMAPRKAGSGSGGSSGTENSGPVCLMSFTVDLVQSPLLRPGLALDLKEGNVILAGKEIGRLSAKLRLMVERCVEEGFGYTGTVTRAGRDKLYYGTFRRFKT